MRSSETVVRAVTLDLENLRAETLPAADGRGGARFRVRLLGEVDVDWINRLYLHQWKELDDLDFHLSENCQEVYFDCPDPDESLSHRIGALARLITTVADEIRPKVQTPAA